TWRFLIAADGRAREYGGGNLGAFLRRPGPGAAGCQGREGGRRYRRFVGVPGGQERPEGGEKAGSLPAEARAARGGGACSASCLGGGKRVGGEFRLRAPACLPLEGGAKARLNDGGEAHRPLRQAREEVAHDPAILR